MQTSMAYPTVLNRAMEEYWFERFDDVICHSYTVRRLGRTLVEAGVKTHEDLCALTEEKVCSLKHVGSESMHFLKNFMEHCFLTFRE